MNFLCYSSEAVSQFSGYHNINKILPCIHHRANWNKSHLWALAYGFFFLFLKRRIYSIKTLNISTFYNMFKSYVWRRPSLYLFIEPWNFSKYVNLFQVRIQFVYFSVLRNKKRRCPKVRKLQVKSQGKSWIFICRF